MSRDIVDKPASQLLFVLGCRFLLFCGLGRVSLLPEGPLIGIEEVAGKSDLLQTGLHLTYASFGERGKCNSAPAASSLSWVLWASTPASLWAFFGPIAEKNTVPAVKTVGMSYGAVLNHLGRCG